MKKIIIACAMAMAVSVANAASLQWGVLEDAILYVSEDGSSVTSPDQYSGDTSGWKFCLVYLGTTDTLDISAVSDSVVVDTFAYGYIDDGAFYADPFTHRFDTTGSATGLDGSSITVSAGDHFGIAFFNGDGYDYVYNSDGSSVGSAVTETAALGSVGATANPVSHYFGGDGVAVSAVPEPSVAILGLLGLGMLLKRRKA